MNTVIVLAAGSGRRFGGDKVKQFVEYAGKPMFIHALACFLDHPEFSEYIVVGKADLLDDYRTHIGASFSGADIRIVAGGEQRIDSLICGLSASTNAEGLIAIHDGARPFLSRKTLDSLLAKMYSDSTHDAVLPVIPLVDTIKYAPGDCIEKTVNRQHYIAAQTPQMIRRPVLDRALKHWQSMGRPAVTDDVQLVELMGGQVHYVEGDVMNKKITVKHDLDDQRGTKYLPRVGIGYDVHRLVSGRPLILGGLTIAHDSGLDGHSDADVLSHAISDALLGACAMGDIGQHFPPSDAQYKDADSLDLLRQLYAKAVASGFKIGNIDAVLACERPKLAEHIPQMCTGIAAALGIDTARVSVKATTTERLGFEGRQEGISCYATCMVFETM